MKRLAYPWDDGQGLAPVIDVPALWALVLDEPELRRLAKRALTRAAGASRLGHGAPVTDDAAFAPIGLEVMRSAAARSALRGFMRSHYQVREPEREIASRLYRHLCFDPGDLDQPKPPLPDSSVTTRERHPNALYLDEGLFESWLRTISLTDGDLPVIAGYAVSFAVLQPELRGSLPEILLRKDERFRALLFPPEKNPE